VLEARGFAKKYDAYCQLFLERQKERTKTVRKTKGPTWNADFEFYVSEPDAQLEVTMFHRHIIVSDAHIGHIAIPVSSLTDGEESTDWFPLVAKKKTDKDPGELHLRILYSKEM